MLTTFDLPLNALLHMDYLSDLTNVNSAASNSPSSASHLSCWLPPLLKQVQAVQDFPQPQKTIRSHLLPWSHPLSSFHSQVCRTTLPLHQLTHGQKPSNNITWTPNTVQVFNASRNILASVILLIHTSHNVLTRLTTDASDQAVDRMLEQLQAGKWVPVAFFSKSLHKAETCYSAFDRELLAPYLAIKYFHYSLLSPHPWTLSTWLFFKTMILTEAYRTAKYRTSSSRHNYTGF